MIQSQTPKPDRIVKTRCLSWSGSHVWRKRRFSQEDVRNPLSTTTATADDQGASGLADPHTLSVTMCIIPAFNRDLCDREMTRLRRDNRCEKGPWSHETPPKNSRRTSIYIYIYFPVYISIFLLFEDICICMYSGETFWRSLIYVIYKDLTSEPYGTFIYWYLYWFINMLLQNFILKMTRHVRLAIDSLSNVNMNQFPCSCVILTNVALYSFSLGPCD